MTRARFFYVLLCVLTAVFAGAIGARAAGSPSAPSVAQGGGADNGWTLPPTAAAEKNPLTVNDAVLASGKKLFGDKCARCHGLHGKGDGPEGDESHQEDMDLTMAARASRNPDGVLFYRIWNGRSASKMEAMSRELTKEQVWALVAYVQTLRARTLGIQ